MQVIYKSMNSTQATLKRMKCNLRFNNIDHIKLYLDCPGKTNAGLHHCEMCKPIYKRKDQRGLTMIPATFPWQRIPTKFLGHG